MSEKDSINKNGSICAVGIGGGGINMIDALLNMAVPNVEPVVMDTDAAALARSRCLCKVQLGTGSIPTGTRSNASIGQQAAGESRDTIVDALAGAQAIFIAAGLGGSTGTGAAPEVAQIARDMGALTIGIVTEPFFFEGLQRRKTALQEIIDFQDVFDALLVFPGHVVITQYKNRRLSLLQGFEMLDQVMCRSIQGLAALINRDVQKAHHLAAMKEVLQRVGLIDFAVAEWEKDKEPAIASILSGSGLVALCTEEARPLLLCLDTHTHTPAEADVAMATIQKAIPENSVLLWNTTDLEPSGGCRVTILALGFALAEEIKDLLSLYQAPLPVSESADAPVFGDRSNIRCGNDASAQEEWDGILTDYKNEDGKICGPKG